MKKVIYLFVLCMVLGLAGCGQSQENKESSTESTSVQVENKNVSDIVSNEHLTNNDTANFQMPEEGYYSNDFDEILNITKEDDGTYRIEYSVTHLLYVENAIGTYDSETGILSFSGKDDRGNDIKAEIENKGDHLEVTVTQSNYEDIIGTKQEFFQADAKSGVFDTCQRQIDLTTGEVACQHKISIRNKKRQLRCIFTT